MGTTVLTAPLEHIKNAMSERGDMLTKPFLDVCKQTIPVLDRFGASMTFVKFDVGGNISRLESMYTSNPCEYNLLYNIVRSEVQCRTAKASSSCTNALLWLTRTMDFVVQLFGNLLEHPDWTMLQACTDSYNKTLKKWHGWVANSAFSVTVQLVPDRKKFMQVLGKSGDVSTDMESFCANLAPLLKQNHKFLAAIGFGSLK